MASTRNKNLSSDFHLETLQNKRIFDNRTFINRQNAHINAFPCAGINIGHMPNHTLSSNATDVESFLYGVNSTNLVNPNNKTFKSFKSNVKQLPSIAFFDRLQTFIPEPLVIQNNTRPLRP